MFSVYANCPVCIITVGGGLLIAKKLGIDDLLVSIWISGLNTAIAFFLAEKIKKKIFSNPYLWVMVFYISTLVYLFYTKQLGHLGNTFLEIDKVFFGMTLGMITFLLANFADKFIRMKNRGKRLFNFQKVIVPLVFLLMVTFIFKLLL
ncbi:MAG: hypothetical protein UR68_C0013G0031 [Candidatus Roizmanbacteria bacterium GW2011_GWA2_35_19]|uniref:Uncharacterized protein n=2 Tax=Candidatus Roizmaniibacteriota TaxID=1752723 RepID=A0A0G0BTV1_9BACT|nr:MAG: hypothetical protein UR63_C0020G0033 [Candidatus Roizmanbacteria bacterium GW2011_GWC2_35_12]KKP72718.1 MAG: hypothetical protein UR68_C0013G0031 [Candidatus Roizmanbacteria bacterium GW2011_GWA2_35_19]